MSFALEIASLALKQGNSITINADGSMTIGQSEVKDKPVKTIKTVKSKNTPEYMSDAVNNLYHGAVTHQVRNKFKTVGSESIIAAHNPSSIRTAFNKMGFGCKIVPTDDPLLFQCKRTRRNKHKGV
jgi:hypothetical protein